MSSNQPITPIKFCPVCASEAFTRTGLKDRTCQQCGFIYFHNTAAAVAAVLIFDNQLLLTERKFDPGKGLLDFPGGFVDYNEPLETALTREIEEELQLTVTQWTYLFSDANEYYYRGIVYQTCDIFFATELANKPKVIAGDDVTKALWLDLQRIDMNMLAFDSVRRAVARLQQSR